MKDLHYVQMQILRELLFHPNSRFSDLNISGLDSDHFSYHIRELVSGGLVKKDKLRYSLTSEGKEFANRMDTDIYKMEKQPKVAVIVSAEMGSGRDKKYSTQRRLKEPYFGYHGSITGKIRYGEKVIDAAAREAKEELGLTATKLQLLYILHEMVYDMKGNMLEDKYFHAVLIKEFEGELLHKCDGGENFWVSEKEFDALTPKYHNEDDIFRWFKKRDRGFKEEVYFIENF